MRLNIYKAGHLWFWRVYFSNKIIAKSIKGYKNLLDAKFAFFRIIKSFNLDY